VASGGGRKGRPEANKVLARNRKARHEYAIDETCEAGLALVGSEVKSIRDGKVVLVDSYAVIEKGEAWLCELDIGAYVYAHARNHDPRRRRKLLLHRTEIDRLADKVRGKGLTLVPLSLYEKDGRVKVELALVHGKQEFDRREDAKSTGGWRAGGGNPHVHPRTRPARRVSAHAQTHRTRARILRAAAIAF